ECVNHQQHSPVFVHEGIDGRFDRKPHPLEQLRCGPGGGEQRCGEEQTCDAKLHTALRLWVQMGCRGAKKGLKPKAWGSGSVGLSATNRARLLTGASHHPTSPRLYRR